jgi:mono/diheme cytochrome c family protein
MIRMMRTVGLLLGLAGAVWLGGCTPPAPVDAPKAEAPVTPPAAYRGAAVAGQVCSRCHDVGMGAPPVIEVGAPKFRDLAERPETTAQSLAAGMRESHPIMPDFILDDGDTAELAAYILGLRGNPG